MKKCGSTTFIGVRSINSGNIVQLNYNWKLENMVPCMGFDDGFLVQEHMKGSFIHQKKNKYYKSNNNNIMDIYGDNNNNNNNKEMKYFNWNWIFNLKSYQMKCCGIIVYDRYQNSAYSLQTTMQAHRDPNSVNNWGFNFI